MARHSDKRERLISAADRLILEQGFKQTTLAEIAEDSGVPPGNVYYYFKTKEDIGTAIIQTRLAMIRSLLADCEHYDDPKQRLLTFLEHPVNYKASLSANGCPLGTLSYELAHSDGPLRHTSRTLIQSVLEWTTHQFKLMGKPNAETLALQYLSNLQGMSLIANTLNDAAVIDTMVEQTRSWLESL